MGFADEWLAVMGMIGLQMSYAVMSLISKAALSQGMSPRVFVFYRQAIAAAVISPIAYFSTSTSPSSPSTRTSHRTTTIRTTSLDFKTFSFIFLATLFGVTINQNAYIEGLYLATSSMATAMINLIPAITFFMAAIARLESVDITSLRSVAKIAGTVICVCGAMCVTFLRGPKLLINNNNSTDPHHHHNINIILPIILENETKNWLLGSLSLVTSCCSWSIWLILQVPITRRYPNHLCLSAWTCFLGAIQSGLVCFMMEPNLEAWKIHSTIELVCYLFSGICGSGIGFLVQSWCISKRGPVFSAMFNPLCTVLTTFSAAIFLQEEIFTGALFGGICIIFGLYIVLWGKANDYVKVTGDGVKSDSDTDESDSVTVTVTVSSEEQSGRKKEKEEDYYYCESAAAAAAPSGVNTTVDLEESLLNRRQN